MVGITDEEPALVEPYLAQHRVAYPIAIDKENVLYRESGFRGIPSAVLVGADGTIRWTGHPGELSEGEVKKALRGGGGAKPKGPLAKAYEACVRSEYGRAIGELNRLLESDLEPEVQQEAESLRDELSDAAGDLELRAMKAEDKKQYLPATRIYTQLAEQFQGTEEGEAGAKKLAEWKRNKKIQKEIRAAELLDEARALRADWQIDRAYGKLRALVKRHEGTAAATEAESIIDEIRKDGLLGFDCGCAKCRAAKRACAKHRVP